MEKPIVLCYSVPEELVRCVGRLAMTLGGKAHSVTPSERRLPIAAAASFAETNKGIEDCVYFEELPEPMLVFVNFPEAKLEAMLTVMRKHKVGIGVLKAILTPRNASWTMNELYNELVRERRAMKG